MSTTAAKPAGNCWRCGGQLYENLAHVCTTSVVTSPVTVPARRPEDDALDRLEAAVVYWLPDSQDDKYRGMVCREAQDVIATVRETLERQREERDAARDAFQDANASASGYRADRDAWRQRAEAAEAEVRQLREERDSARSANRELAAERDEALDALDRLEATAANPYRRRRDRSACNEIAGWAATVREALERQREHNEELLLREADACRAHSHAEAEVRRLKEMVRGHHQSLAAIGGGPCICDICSASPSDGGGAK